MMRTRAFKPLAGLAVVVVGMTASTAGEVIKGDPDRALPVVEKLCAGCHGMDGNGVAPMFPKLAGQHPEYLLHELHEYKKYHRDNPMMSPLVQDLTDETMADLAVYFARQKPTPGTVGRPELLPLGKKIYLEGNSESGVPSCDGCHEEDGTGSSRFPRLAGQHPEYTVEQLKLYHMDKRPHGKKVMRTIADRLTEQEAQAVAEYIASLP